MQHYFMLHFIWVFSLFAKVPIYGFPVYKVLIILSFPCLLAVTVIEVLPKEKKQKEEKTLALGQCTVDLLPLVKGMPALYRSK